MTLRPAGVPLRRPRVVTELVEAFGGRASPQVRGRVVSRVAPADLSDDEGDLVVVASPRFVAPAAVTRGVLLCDAALAPRLSADRVYAHEHPWWVVAELIADEASKSPLGGNAHVQAGAIVHPEAVIAVGAVVHAGARIGAGSVVGEYAVIYGNVTIGERVSIAPHAVLGRTGFGWAKDPSGRFFRIPHGGGVVVDDDADIGPFCSVDAGTLAPTRIGRGARLDAHVHVAHNVQIGPGAFIAAQSGFAGSATIGAGVLVGGQAGFSDHVRVGDGARIAAKSGVIGDIPAGAVVAGFPAVTRMRWLRAMSSLLGRGAKTR